MNKLILTVLALTTLALPSRADQTLDAVRADEELLFNIPQSKNGMGPDVGAKWSLAKLATAEYSTTGVNPDDGGILVDFACVSSTDPAGGYAEIKDTDNTDTIALGSQGFKMAARIKAAIVAATSTDSWREVCRFFPSPIPLRHGLGIINSNANIVTSVGYRRIRFDK